MAVILVNGIPIPDEPKKPAPAEPITIAINLHKDGDAWCALIGPDLQEGTAGFGETQADALESLAMEFRRKDQLSKTGSGDYAELHALFVKLQAIIDNEHGALAKVRYLTGELEKERAMNETMINERCEVDDEVTRLKADNERLQSEHQTLRDEYNSLSATAADMNATITDREAEIERLQAEVANLNRELEKPL